MKLKLDSEQYSAKQEIFAGELVARIGEVLEKHGMHGTALKEVAGDVAFTVACIVDDVSGLEFEGVEANPYLTFLSGDDELIHLGGNSYSHELIFPILNAMYADDT